MADTLKKIKGKCVDLSFEGKGVIKIPGNAVFVDALLPNEEADIEIIYKRNGVYFGKVKRLYNLSPNRIKPLCGVSTSCGGCVFQNYAYKSQLEFKKDVIYDHVEKCLREYEGVYAYLVREIARKFEGKYKFINREDDSGDLNLRYSKESYHPSLEDAKLVVKNSNDYDNFMKQTIYRAKGCEKCEFEGYQGRLGVYEVLRITKELKKLIAINALELDIQDTAVKLGMQTLHQACLQHILAGETTINEFVRVLGPVDD